MNGPGNEIVPDRIRRRRRNPGKTSLNLGIAALAVAAGGYIVGLLVAWALGGGVPARHLAFMPVGGLASLFLAVMAIQTGFRTKKFFGRLTPVQRERLGYIIDLDDEGKKASLGITLGAISLVLNPLLGFLLYAILR